MRQATSTVPGYRTLPVGVRLRRIRPPPLLSGRNRYSAFVGLMKVALPATAAALILLVVAWPQFVFEDDRFRLSVSKLAPEQAQSLTMLNARYEGIDAKNQPYTITADMATRSMSDEDLIELQLPKADITLDDGTWLALNARTGYYRRESRLLDLAGSVNLFHDQGFEMRTEAARIDLDKGTANGAQAVEGQGAFGFINAEGFRVLDRGARIFFTGATRLIVLPNAKDVLR
ncbi:MAG: LPS export ABC transporter periplasmic protein LptC [Kiloniellaceae bacterium]